MTLKLKLLAGIAGSLLLSACDSSEGGDGTAQGIESFGSAFVAMFGAGPNDEPVDAQSVDIAVDLTGDPFNP